MIELVEVSPLEAAGIVMHLSWDTRYGSRTVADTIHLIAPPINAGQYFVFAHDEQPVGFVSWAHMSETSVKKYLPLQKHIEPEDWVSGEQVWIMAVYIVSDLRACFKIVRSELRRIANEQGWPPVFRWVRDKGRIEMREMRYA